MHDRYVITWKTERGQFRCWDNYSDRSKSIARELMAMGALGVEVYRTDRQTVVFAKGEACDPN